MARRSIGLLLLVSACGARTSPLLEEPAIEDSASIGSDTAAPLPITPDSNVEPPPPVDSGTPETIFVGTCAEWSLPKTLACSPTSVVMDADTTVFELDPDDGRCQLRKVGAHDSHPRPSPRILWMRDRKNCYRDLCYGFDSFHLGAIAIGESGVWGEGGRALGTAPITGASAGWFDGSAACGDLGCFRDLPVGANLTLKIELRAFRTRELCRTLDLVLRYDSDRKLSVVSLLDRP